MNYVLHLNAWMSSFGDDERLKMQHYALYMALFYQWNQNRFSSPITIIRAEVMRNAGIGSVNFYIRTIKELSEWGYILYEPSFNRFKGSLVHLHRFDNGREKASDNSAEQDDDNASDQTTDTDDENGIIRDNGHDKACDNATDQGCDNRSDKGIVSDNGRDKGGGKGSGHARDKGRETLYINNTNSINTINRLNSVNDYGTSNENSNFVNDRGTDANPQTTRTGNHHRQKQTAGAGGRGGRRSADAIPASVPEAQAYFLEQHSTADEAEKFCNHYQANGWLVSGRAPMQDWRAAARNWIKNAKNFNHGKQNTQPIPGPVNTGPKKYGTPL